MSSFETSRMNKNQEHKDKFNTYRINEGVC